MSIQRPLHQKPRTRATVRQLSIIGGQWVLPALQDPERCFREGRERKEKLPRPYGEYDWDIPDKDGIPELDLGEPEISIEAGFRATSKLRCFICCGTIISK